MSRRSKGPRLYWQKPRRARRATNNHPAKPREPGVWLIRDGSIKRSTGAGQGETDKAENALTAYLNEKAAPRISNRDPAAVPIADVVSIYIEDVAPKHASPKDTAARLGKILDHFENKTLSCLNDQTCQAYVTWRNSPVARRELEDLRSAVRYHWKRGLCSALTPVVLPQRGNHRERWLTRAEATRLLWTAWRLTQTWKGHKSDRRTAQHVAYFVLAGLYAGRRAGAITGAALRPNTGKGWIDATHGVWYAPRGRKTKKRQSSIRIPPRLLAHVRRRVRLRLSIDFFIEWQGEPVKRINKAFRAAAKAAKLGRDVTPHTLRHTAITWQAQAAVPVHEICGFFSITREMFEEVYGHHHPDYQTNAVNALSRPRQKPDRMTATDREQTQSKVVALDGKR